MKSQGRKFEKRVRQTLIRLERRSGGAFGTGDISTGLYGQTRWSIEVKERAKSLTLNEKLLKSVWVKAKKHGQLPCLFVKVGDFECYIFFKEDVAFDGEKFMVGG